ncbi:hypothetical protein LCGC14_1394890 [marine sediment metagenome]|uniref:Uncharacterized protein n=1 Tax=marine sediment metagenome TaxID=412755 RepID=A0A0F9MEE0_9ZZZZ
MDLVIERQQKSQRPKSTKKPDKRPARARYWSERHLEKHKVRNLIRCNGMTRTQALVFWREVRIRRMKKLF